ncbi:MAG TPA: PA14 domain-containing protein [Steroidobacteraceae bacterium]|jgi:phage tail-like protein|nr:PA14 domain-containing protein [Steroidobacteraceae bacterium]
MSMDLPVRHLLLRDDLTWSAVTLGLTKAADGSLSLTRLPAPAVGAAVLRDGPFEAAPSGIVAYDGDQVFIANTLGRQLILEQRNCAARFAVPIDAMPAGLAIGGNILYVADPAQGRVLCFTSQLELRHVIHSAIQQPTALAVDSRGRLYVLDRGLRRVLRFASDGGLDAGYSPQVDEPVFLVLDGDVLWVSDAAQNSVNAFDADGTSIAALSLPARDIPVRPGALAVHANLVLVADAASGAILAFDSVSHRHLGEVPDFRAPLAAMSFDATGNLYLKLDGGADCLSFAAGAGCIGRGTLETGVFDAGELNDWERVALTATPLAASIALSTFSAASRNAVPANWQSSESLDCLLARDPGDAEPTTGTRRFLWLRIVLSSADGRESPVLRQARAQTVAPSYLDELPRIFRRDDREQRFLERWLALFRSGLEDREQRLEDSARDFDPMMAPAERLAFTAAALAFELPRGLTPTQQRALLARVPELYRNRGTLAGVADMAEVMSGIRPRIIEAFHARRVWQLGTTSLLGFDTALAAATPEGLVVPRDARTDPAYAGLRGEYYAGTDFNDLLRARTDERLDFAELWVEDRDLHRMRPYTVRWSGQIKPRYSETYLLRLEHGPGTRLWIDGQLIIDRWTPSLPPQPDPRVVLDATRWHAIQIEILSLDFTSVARLSWSSRHQPPEVVPAHSLYSVLDEHADLDAPPAATFDVGHAVVGESGPLAQSEFGAGLFADYAHLFTVLAPAGSCRDASHRAELRAAIDAEKPAHTDYHLCFVEPRMRVGFQARLGIDAIVGNGPPPLRLDGTRLDRDSFLDDAAPGGGRVAARARLGQDTVVG